MSFDRYVRTRWRTTAVAVTAAIALAVGVALNATSSGGAASRPRTARVAATTPGPTFAHTRAGAVAAATTWCQIAGEAFYDGGWFSAVTAMGDQRVLAMAERVKPAAAFVQSRIRAAHTPFVVRSWVLGYAVQQYSAAAARVRVWQLYALAIAGPLDTTGFQSTTVSLLWIHGTWKITASHPGPDLAPPRHGAGASEIASWISAVNRLNTYTYAP
jgi:hypothetical protein